MVAFMLNRSLVFLSNIVSCWQGDGSGDGFLANPVLACRIENS
jgi:hypothetical protein